MDTKANYTAVGLFVILLSALMIIGFVWLSGFSQHQTYQTYLVYARGGVTGLNIDSPVQFNGVRVGTVSKIQLDAKNPQLVKLYLKIETQIPITESTIATLIPQGITGLVYVGLKAGSAEMGPLKIEKDQPYPVIPYEKPLLMQLSDALPSLTKNISEITEKVKRVFSDQNLESISDTLANLDKISSAFAQESHTLSHSLKSLDLFLKNSAAASRHFDAILSTAQQTAGQLNKTSAQLSVEISNFGQQTMPSIEELLTRLNDTTASLQQISQDLESNPAILIRGKQPPPPGPGE